MAFTTVDWRSRMGNKFMTNSDVIKLFEKIDMLKQNNDISKEILDYEISKIHDKIANGLSFLVYSNAKPYKSFPNYEDLVQEGYEGLIKAIKRFDYTLFPNFFVYSEKWIRHRIKRAASRFDIVYCPNRNRVIYAEPSEIGREEEIEETPENLFFAEETKHKIIEALGEFSDREKDIMMRIFGLGDYNIPQTLREVGPSYGLTHERIRQIKEQVISKLRKNEKLNELY